MKHIHFIAITIFFTAILLGVFLLSRRTAIPAHISDAGSIELLQQNILLQSASFNRLQFNGVDSATDINGTRTAMKDIFNERRLALRFNETNCDVCVETELQALRKLGQSIGAGNIVILASYASQRDFKIVCQTYGINFPAYNILPDAVSSPVEEANRPYLFVADSTLLAGYLFVPSKELPKISEAYYRMVSQLWNVQTDRNIQTAPANVEPTHLRIDNHTYRFGTLHAGDDATATFTIANTGKSPLLLQEVQATCGCTVPEWSRQPVPPGQTAIVKLKYDTKITGIFSKKAFIFSNAAGSPHGVTISGEVVGE
jgi:hypothetical protein